MEELRRLVEKLEDAKGDKKEQKLQEICEKLINSYTIQIGDTKIEPMLVEAYYHCAGKFEDESVHAANKSKANTYELARKRQENHFGELYVHYGCKDGLDIVLSNDDYYLSFLIKNALVNEDFKKQCAISEYICGKCDKRDECDKGFDCKHYGKKDLLKKVSPSRGKKVVFLVRKGINGEFAKKKIAALPIDDIRKYEFTPGECKTTLIKSYIKEQLKNEHADKTKLRELAKGMVTWEYFEK